MKLSIIGAYPAPEMDRKIWRKLPIELLERILSFLPLKIFLSLLSTCKHFKSLILSPLFISTYSNSSISSFLLLSHPQSPHYLLYDPVLNTWRDLNLSLPRFLKFTPLLTTATCLLCFSAVPDSSNSCFVIFNMFTRSSRTVEFPEYPFAFELLTLVTNANGYKIFCSSITSKFAYVYDSRANNWTRFLGFQQTLGDGYHQQGVLFKDRLYFVTREPFRVVSFELSSGKWERLDVYLPEELTFVRLVAGAGAGAEIGNGNGLFMFGGIGRNGISKSMKVWELVEEGNERRWREIESVPELMSKKFGSVCYHNYEHIYCYWHKGMICVCCYTWPEVLYYKVGRRTWHWVPISPSLPDKWSCGFKWFSFVPELYALI
ncbi:F-box/kelch-repeat protein At5g43190-like [Rutidosis leptorrhynchoides]|uniref:F-box/kelch-repeat protein At5g43190-like n=1 Tax=Rutidosis leptorrhynchoides TaxID=125765 RepID=UPI003A9A6013